MSNKLCGPYNCPSNCLERVSRPQYREGEPRRSPTGSLSEGDRVEGLRRLRFIGQGAGEPWND